MTSEHILEVKGLTTEFRTATDKVLAVDNLDFTLGRGETLAIVGESGCGKSVTSLSILRLIPDPPGRILAGQILYNGQNLLELAPRAMRKIRGSDISMVFQEPMTSLNPVFTIGRQIMESLIVHQNMDKRQARARATEMLSLVGMPNPDKRLANFPHQLSGGMRQRVMIAMALACNPNILIADEPTTALDVTIQAQILRLMADLKAKLGTAIVFITHDLGVVAQFAQNVMVMYAGEAVEYTDVKTLFHKPSHPYTLGLLRSLPDPERAVDMLYTIPGTVDQSAKRSVGCKFTPRCAYCVPRCETHRPPLMEIAPGHRVRCWEWERMAAHAD